MLVPKVKVERINPEDNIRFIRNYLSKDKQENNTRPFYEKTIALYPELRDIDRVTDEDERETMIRGVVLRRLEDNREEIRRRMDYFSERFDMFMDGFIEASCRLFNYEWKTEINHMIFFEKWQEMHGGSIREPAWPDPLWYLEEIIVDPTLNEESVRKHTLYENKAYPLFYEPDESGESMMDRIQKLFRSRKSMEDFLEKAYAAVCKEIKG